MFYFYCFRSLTVRLLETSTSTASSVFLWFTSTWVTNKKVTVVVQQSLSQLVLAALINVLCVVSNNCLSDSSTDSVDLCSLSSSLNANTNIEVSELLLSKDKNWLESLKTKGLRLDKLNWLSVYLDKSTSLLCESTRSSGLFPKRKKERG